MSDRPPIDSVLLVGFGGPTSPDEVLPFLRRVARGRDVPAARLEEVARHYEAVGGRSPYNDLTHQQARGLEAWLAGSGRPLSVYVGFRNAAPFVSDTIARMVSEGRRHAAGVVLAPHRCRNSWDRYLEEVGRAVREAGASGPLVSYVARWFDADGFLEACAQRIEQGSGYRRGAWPEAVPLIFTAHSIPAAMSRGSSYEAELHASCEAVATRLGATRWRLAYQSRSGDPRTPWLGPDVGAALRDCAASGAREVVVHAIGFLCDHVEVLYDLDIEAARLAASVGLNLRRAPCVNAHPAFLGMLGARIARLAAGGA